MLGGCLSLSFSFPLLRNAGTILTSEVELQKDMGNIGSHFFTISYSIIFVTTSLTVTR